MTRLRATAGVLVLVSALLAAGCSGDDDADPPPAGALSATATASPAAASTAAPTSVSPSPSGTPSATGLPSPRPSRVPKKAPVDAIPSGSGTTVVLRGDGLGFASGSTRRQVPFGSSVSTITSALAATLGRGKTSAQPACEQGPRTQVDYNGFRVLLDGGEFVGWTESGSAERDLSTADGIALQVTLAEVRQVYPRAKVSNGSLGPEFVVEGGVSGLLDGTAPQSRVTQLYGGETCFFR